MSHAFLDCYLQGSTRFIPYNAVNFQAMALLKSTHCLIENVVKKVNSDIAPRSGIDALPPERLLAFRVLHNRPEARGGRAGTRPQASTWN